MSEKVRLYGINKLRETLIVAEATRKSMRANKGQESGPERLLRLELWRQGFRGYRKNVRKLVGTPDIVFGRKKLAIFVHGCFWHGHDCGKARLPTQNRTFWQEKIRRNDVRHEKNSHLLESMGFKVLTIWECELKADLGACVEEIRRGLDA